MEHGTAMIVSQKIMYVLIILVSNAVEEKELSKAKFLRFPHGIAKSLTLGIGSFN